ncbi:MAG TPA: hypothetical protein VKE40_26435 [Gemmataceae bacterium]|nr:hypothetical protein [Gemmataceae bacterium]
MSTSIALVCETPVDRDTVTILVHGLLCASVTWIEADSVQSFCSFRGLLASEPCLMWEHVPAIAKQYGQRFPGKFKGLPREAYTAFQALVLLLLISRDRPDAVLLVRDSSRKESLHQARQALTTTAPIVIGVAHTKRECWVITAFEATSDEERRLLDEVRREIGFDPRTNSHELTAKHGDDKHSAKRVLAVLTANSRERETVALQTIPLDTLRDRGRENGLAEFLAELSARLLPLFDPRPAG